MGRSPSPASGPAMPKRRRGASMYLRQRQRVGLIALILLCALQGPAALAQSVDIPLQLVQSTLGVQLLINVGIDGGASRPYLFDTGSSVFNAFYSPQAF